jgi:hypothetical protein
MARTVRVLARVASQSPSWSLKSAGDANARPGRNEVSKNPLLRSTIPLNSGSRGGASLILVASVPANAAAGDVSFPVPPIADSRSQTSVLVTRPSSLIRAHMPESRSPPWREGNILAARNRENANVITSTGRIRACPAATGTGVSGNHKSHWVISPGW